MKVHWDENDTIKSRGWMLDAMASYRVSIRSQQISQLHVQLPPLSGRDSAPAAAQSLMAGFGRMTRINTSIRRSSFTSRPNGLLPNHTIDPRAKGWRLG
ncbi:hypothetical protein M405DRAFT_804874 [Rhizopogon salebrosus TDB-379]|nr:hypothetical protein M405DRAFT_804874 [Rhizopogon salebrosus TDB-379]